MKKLTLLLTLTMIVALSTNLMAAEDTTAQPFDWDVFFYWFYRIIGGVGGVLATSLLFKARKFVGDMTFGKMKAIVHGAISKFSDNDEEKKKLNSLVDGLSETQLAKSIFKQTKEMALQRLDYIDNQIEDWQLKLETLGDDLTAEQRERITSRIAYLKREKEAIVNEDTA